MRKSALFIVLLTCPSAVAQTDYPTLLGAHPTGVQRGQTTDILVYTWRSNLAGAYTLLFDGDPGDFQTKILSDGKQGPLSVRLTVAPEARPGIRQFRVATPQGVSTVAALVVAVDDIVVDEREVVDELDSDSARNPDLARGAGRLGRQQDERRPDALAAAAVRR